MIKESDVKRIKNLWISNPSQYWHEIRKLKLPWPDPKKLPFDMDAAAVVSAFIQESDIKLCSWSIGDTVEQALLRGFYNKLKS